jgi:hypothetical protein
LYLAQGVVVSRGVIYELNSSSGISEAVSRSWRHHISETLGLEKENNKEKKDETCENIVLHLYLARL